MGPLGGIVTGVPLILPSLIVITSTLVGLWVGERNGLGLLAQELRLDAAVRACAGKAVGKLDGLPQRFLFRRMRHLGASVHCFLVMKVGDDQSDAFGVRHSP